MEVKVLTENTVYKRAFLGEHGLSLLIETENQNYLFDMGQSDVFLRNGRKLQVDWKTLDGVVLSHGHYDHCGGMNYWENAQEIPETGAEKFPIEYNEALLKVTTTQANLTAEEALKIFKYDYDTSDKLHTIIPILGGGQRWGTLILTRYAPDFNDEDLVLGEYGATVVGLEIQRRKALEEEEESRQRAVVQMAIGTLSYSEIEAVQQIFAELEGDEGLLVASKIADRSGITRSVIVNALRKLESAGVIESRSLGMKGTHIKIINSKFHDELASLNI